MSCSMLRCCIPCCFSDIAPREEQLRGILKDKYKIQLLTKVPDNLKPFKICGFEIKNDEQVHLENLAKLADKEFRDKLRHGEPAIFVNKIEAKSDIDYRFGFNWTVHFNRWELGFYILPKH